MTTTKGNFRRARDDGALNEQRSRVKLVSRRTRGTRRGHRRRRRHARNFHLRGGVQRSLHDTLY